MDGDRAVYESALRVCSTLLDRLFAKSGSKLLLRNVLHLEDYTVLLLKNGNDFAGFLLPFAADHFNGITLFHVILFGAFFRKHQSTSGASDIIFMKFFSRSSACHRAENTSSFRVLFIIDDHRGILIESEVGSVRTADLRSGSDNHSLHDFTFFYCSAGNCFLYSGSNDIADPGITSLLPENGKGVIRFAPELSATSKLVCFVSCFNLLRKAALFGVAVISISANVCSC